MVSWATASIAHRFTRNIRGSTAQVEEDSDFAPPKDEGPLPEGWTAHPDPRSGRIYYVGPSGNTTWDRPAAPGAAPPPPPPPLPPSAPARSVNKEDSKGDDEMSTGKIQSVGKVEFPNSRRDAARWMRVAPIPNMPKGTSVDVYDQWRVRAAWDTNKGHVDVNGAEWAVKTRESAMRDIVSHFLKKFKMPPPSVLISVNGGADTLDITPKQKAVFRQGLLDAAKQASAGGDDDEVKSAAWIVTSGTDSGVMELVGKTMRGLEEVNVPLWTFCRETTP